MLARDFWLISEIW